MQFNDLDYFRTESGIIYIVRGNSHPNEFVFASPVYWPDQNGDRISEDGRRYRKEVIESPESCDNRENVQSENYYFPKNVFVIPEKLIVEQFDPRSVIEKFKREFKNTIWLKIFDSLIEVGIPEKDIGIFGSYLVGLNRNVSGELVKDIDFLIYGEENCHCLKKRMKELLDSVGLHPISQDHINYEAKKLGSAFLLKNNDFQKSLANKWSSIQVAPGILTTIRFVQKNGELANYIETNDQIVDQIATQGEVIDDFGTSFEPRTFKLLANGQVLQILTYYWVYHQVVKNGDIVKVTGNLHKSGLISIDNRKQGIKIIGGENEVLSSQCEDVYPPETGWRGAVRTAH